MFILLESKANATLFDDDNLTSYRYIGKYAFAHFVTYLM